MTTEINRAPKPFTVSGCVLALFKLCDGAAIPARNRVTRKAAQRIAEAETVELQTFLANQNAIGSGKQCCVE